MLRQSDSRLGDGQSLCVSSQVVSFWNEPAREWTLEELLADRLSGQSFPSTLHFRRCHALFRPSERSSVEARMILAT